MPVGSSEEVIFQKFVTSGAGSLPIVMPYDDSSSIDICAFISKSLI